MMEGWTNNNVCVSSNDLTCGSVNIDIANVPQNRVEGLEKTLEDIAVCVNDSRKRVGDLEHSVELNKNDLKRFVKAQIDINDTVNDKINDINLQHNVFKSAHFALIKEIHKTLIIGFSVLVVFMLVTWGYLTYTFFKQ